MIADGDSSPLKAINDILGMMCEKVNCCNHQNKGASGVLLKCKSVDKIMSMVVNRVKKIVSDVNAEIVRHVALVPDG